MRCLLLGNGILSKCWCYMCHCIRAVFTVRKTCLVLAKRHRGDTDWPIAPEQPQGMTEGRIKHHPTAKLNLDRKIMRWNRNHWSEWKTALRDSSGSLPSYIMHAETTRERMHCFNSLFLVSLAVRLMCSVWKGNGCNFFLYWLKKTFLSCVCVCVCVYVCGWVCVCVCMWVGGWCRSESVSEPTTPLTFTQQPRWTASQEIQTQQLQPFDTVITENQ